MAQTEVVSHGKWGSSIEFLITSLGFAVGLGNVWRFPYKVYSNGGAVFLIPYALALIFLAIPLQLLEASIGQYSKKGPVGVWNMAPLLKGIGFATCYSTIISVVYYNTPISWACYYFVRSMTDVLPWSSCNSNWDHPCVEPTSALLNETTNTSSAEIFFYEENLKITNDILDWGEFVWPLFVCNTILWILLFAGVSFGASSLGKVAYFTSLFPYIMLTIMIGFTASLPGSMKGVEFYLLKVDLNRLKDIKVWRDAVAQVFYSTNCGFGASIQLASYNKFHHNVLRDATLIPILDGITSIFAGFSVFTVLGYMATIRGVDVEKVVSDGPGLIFITYAEAFSQISGGNIWSVFFFFMVIVLGLSSQFPCVEMLCGVISDYFTWFRSSRVRNISMRACFSVCGLALSIIFFFGCGYYWYFLIDELAAAIPLMIIGLAELVGVAWVYSKPFFTSSGHKLIKNIEQMTGRLKYTKWFWFITWTFVAPLTLAFILIYDMVTFSDLVLTSYPWNITMPDGEYAMPKWSTDVAWSIVALCPALIVLIACWVTCYDYKAYKIVRLAAKPSNWVAAESREQSPVNSRQSSMIKSTKLPVPPPVVMNKPATPYAVNYCYEPDEETESNEPDEEIASF